MSTALVKTASLSGLVVVALAVAGCSAPASTPVPEDAPVSSSPSPEPQQSAPPVQPPPGPLEAYLRFSDDLDSPETIAARVTWRENLTAACMAAQGFEYIPVVPTPEDIELEEGLLPGTPEYVEQYGYGVWRQPSASGGYHWEKGIDPNDALVAAMSDAGRDAYVTALSGPVISENHDDGSVMREGGCSSAADTPTGDDVAYLVTVRREAMDYLTTLDQDTRFADIDAAWASCMADAGFSDRTPHAAQERIQQEQLAAFVDGVAPAASVIADGAAEERRVAVADFECRDTTDWTARHRAVEIELQQEYVDAHLADLEALVDAMAPRTD